MLAALHQCAIRVDAEIGLAVTGFLGGDGGTRAVELSGHLAALLFQGGKTRRERHQPVVEQVELEIVHLHGQQRLNVRMHESRWSDERLIGKNLCAGSHYES